MDRPAQAGDVIWIPDRVAKWLIVRIPLGPNDTFLAKYLYGPEPESIGKTFACTWPHQVMLNDYALDDDFAEWVAQVRNAASKG
jgi:hypothetical protein